MSDIREEEWELLREQFGDLAYEEPHNHRLFLALLAKHREDKEVDADKQKARRNGGLSAIQA